MMWKFKEIKCINMNLRWRMLLLRRGERNSRSYMIIRREGTFVKLIEVSLIWGISVMEQVYSYKNWTSVLTGNSVDLS